MRPFKLCTLFVDPSKVIQLAKLDKITAVVGNILIVCVGERVGVAVDHYTCGPLPSWATIRSVSCVYYSLHYSNVKPSILCVWHVPNYTLQLCLVMRITRHIYYVSVVSTVTDNTTSIKRR